VMQVVVPVGPESESGVLVDAGATVVEKASVVVLYTKRKYQFTRLVGPGSASSLTVSAMP
jgi:hypothetical protein